MRKLVDKCLTPHTDGEPWGFRALLPGAAVFSPVSEPEPEPAEAHRNGAAAASPSVEQQAIPDTPIGKEPAEAQAAEDTPPAAQKPEAPASEQPSAAEPGESNAAEGEDEDTAERPAIKLSSLKSAAAEEAESEEPAEEEEEPTQRLIADGAPAGDEDEAQKEQPDVDEMPTQTLADEQAEEQQRKEEAAGEDDEANHELGVELVELSPSQIDERMLPTHDDSEARIALLSGADEPPEETEDVSQAPTAELSPSDSHYKLTTGNTGKLRRLRSALRGHHTQRRRRNRWRTYISLAIVAALLIAVLMPLGAVLTGYGVYNHVKSVAQDGVNHLLKVKELLPVSKSNPMAALDADKLQQVQQEFKAANGDFLQLQALVERPDVRSALQQFAPDYVNQLTMAKHLVQVALDVTRMGDELSGVGIMAAGIVHGSPLASGNTKPLMTAQDVATVQGSLVHALYYIGDIRQQMSQVDMRQLPMLNAKQKSEITALLGELPKVQDMIGQAQELLPAVSWLLGVDGTRHFLLQTMDSAELRPGGGFTGQYGVLTIENGRMGAVSLRDVALLDYAGNGYQMGRNAPAGYSWMHMGNFGLRDSNISGDYPTTARINMQIFQDEGGGPVDGDIAFTPAFIGHIIDVTGPIYVKEYHETITSKNLADRLHYYQQDYSAIAREQQVTGKNTHDTRKAFTSLLAKLLLDKVRHLPTNKLLDIVKGATKDLQSRDLEIYFANPTAENWLQDHGYGGNINSFKDIDGFHVVQANISVNKASQYVHSTFEDDVTLDAQGGATHNLTITLDYDQRGNVYGFDTYTDYIRVYAPAGAQFISGSGFDSGHPVCGSGTKSPRTSTTAPGGKPSGCDAYNYIPPDGSRSCPSGNYSLGTRYLNPPVDSVGGPTATSSDLPGRSMWGGLTETPKNCTSTITLSWYVPHAHVNKNNPASIYRELVGKQGGVTPTVIVNVDASALHLKGVKNLHKQQDIHADQIFTLTGPQPKPQPKPGATPTSTPGKQPTKTPTAMLALPASTRRQ